ncbi:MAG: pentapeptide repeat-containing protein [Deltaproteobacteria bacterium]|nr:pentapeptide repeat-containing protein [Deltaproteobacteria bacterium]
MEERKCKYFDVCGLYAEADEDPPLCILHSTNPKKDADRFRGALEEHRKDNFSHIWFPETADFSNVTFNHSPNFLLATFYDDANFSGSKFPEGASFFMATFFEKADFSNAEFSKEVIFMDATFSGEVDFSFATFSNEADFFNATFSEKAKFLRATFLGKTTFIGEPTKEGANHLFSEVINEVDFTNVTVYPPEALIFRDADLRQFIFEQTDLRKAEFTGVIWPKTEERFQICRISLPKPGKRYQVYDEIRPLKTGEFRKLDHIERLYRELKQNYEDRRDYERAGDFHYGEKEMRRKNPNTPVLLKVMLTLYCWVSGYGERYVRPLVWAFGLLLVCTFGYLYFGIKTAN